MKKHLKSIIKIVLPLALGGGILWWTYRDFDFSAVSHTLLYEMNLWWLALSLVFEVLSHVLRGLRWKQTLEPLGERPRTETCINAIFLSYAVSLLIPRSGEVARCGVLKRYDGVSFTKSLGTVVTERVVDMVCVLLIALMVVMLQFDVLRTFFMEKGMSMNELASVATSSYLIPGVMLALVVCIAGYFLLLRLSIAEKVKGVLRNLWEGICSVRRVKNVPLFLLYSAGVWGSYIMQFYLTFYCFPFTADLGFKAGLAVFITTSFAVLVPTPNGAGPWHYVVISMLTLLYGVSESDAGTFALIVHGTQTAALILLGVYAMIRILPKGSPSPNPSLYGGE
ncbi:MAG: flippase-like domain-containing protein [Bacteroidaceae bacterium]|nr:flippase-like domain-containing protein [Bacteroidaceae bacterium]